METSEEDYILDYAVKQAKYIIILEIILGLIIGSAFLLFDYYYNHTIELEKKIILSRLRFDVNTEAEGFNTDYPRFDEQHKMDMSEIEGMIYHEGAGCDESYLAKKLVSVDSNLLSVFKANGGEVIIVSSEGHEEEEAYLKNYLRDLCGFEGGIEDAIANTLTINYQFKIYIQNDSLYGNDSIYHEMGHVLDNYNNGESGEGLSGSDEFKQLRERNIEFINLHCSDYALQTGDEEIFANLFSLYTTKILRNDEIKTYFDERLAELR